MNSEAITNERETATSHVQNTKTLTRRTLISVTVITMPKAKRNISDVDESEGGFIDDEEAPKSKKTKTKIEKKKAPVKAASKPSQFWSVSLELSFLMSQTAQCNQILTMPQLSNGKQPRRVEITEFKGSTLINIREFYEKDDEYHPGKKVLSLEMM